MPLANNLTDLIVAEIAKMSFGRQGDFLYPVILLK